MQRALTAERLSEADALRIYRGLARAKAGGQQPQTEETDDAIAIAVEEYAMAVATTHLQVQYPHHRVTQQPYGTVGFDAIVGTALLSAVRKLH